MSGGTEAWQKTNDEHGRIVQWTNGKPGPKCKVTFYFHSSAAQGCFSLGLGTEEVELDNVALIDPEVVAVDVNPAGTGGFRVYSQGVLAGYIPARDRARGKLFEESVTVVYDGLIGRVQFSICSPLCTGNPVLTVERASLKNLQFYPTALFEDGRSIVRVDMDEAPRAPETVKVPDNRCFTSNFLPLLDGDAPCGSVTFSVEGRSIRADRFLLAARSEYFDAMFRAGLSEGKADVVPLQHSHAAFMAVLRFLYAGGCPSEEEVLLGADSFEVLHLSIEFLLDDLVKICEARLMHSLTMEKALLFLRSLARARSKVPDLVGACLETLRGHMKEICAMPGFGDLCRDPDVMRALLEDIDEPNAKKRKIDSSGKHCVTVEAE